MTVTEKANEEGAPYSLGLDDYKVLFESSMDALIVFEPEHKRLVMCNPASCKLFGFKSNKEFVRHSVYDLSAEYQPDGRLSAEVIDSTFNAISKDNAAGGRWLCKRQDGESFLAEVKLILIDLSSQEMVIANLKDITEEARIEAELRDNMFSLDAAVNGTGVGLWDWDIENNKLILNDNWFDMLGYTRHDFEEKYEQFAYNTFADYVHPDDLLKVQEELKRHYKGEIDYYRVEIRMKSADNGWKWMLAAGKVCEWSGDKPRRMVGIHTDIDYRVKMEEELRQAIIRAEESDKLKSAFLANMSHEIRTPMNGIIGFMDLMVSPDTTQKQRKEYSEIIRKSSQQLLEIVNHVLDMSKIEAGQIDIIESLVDLKKMMNELRNKYSGIIKEGVRFRLEHSGAGITDNILSDQAKLYQIFSNLLSNSAKFTSSGEISLAYSLEGDMLKFYVRDTGEGIDPSFHEVIFDRFRQVEVRPVGLIGGTGLGLSICKAYVEKMGGEIWLESEKGKGSVFYFTIPYKPVEYRKKDIGTSTKGGSKGKGMEGIILVVEDELYNYLFAEYVLKGRGYQVIHAESGLKAIDYVKLYPEIKLVIMDIRLPDITGYEVTSEIKKLRPELPVIALTALALAGDRESALDAGCDDYLKKPITKENLIESVASFLENKK
ncbi:MAG: response regulator [Bacteroidales bacterium]|nr:response regulator [Bacteroidales bacterium]